MSIAVGSDGVASVPSVYDKLADAKDAGGAVQPPTGRK